MGTKKDESRFTIKFDSANPRQREAMRILNQVDRRKAALITDAILCMYGYYGTNMATSIAVEKPSNTSSPKLPMRESTPEIAQDSPVEMNADLQDVLPAQTPDVPRTNQPEDGKWRTITESVDTFF